MRRIRLSVALLLVSICALAGDSVSLSYDAFFLEAMVQRQKGNHDATFDLLQHCIKLNPQASEAYYYLAQYYQMLRNDSLAQQCYLKAAELEPDNPTFLETVAQSYIRQQDYAKAIKVVEQLYNQDKSREELLEMLFELYQQTDDTDKAIATLNRIEANEGKSERLSFAKSEIYTKMGNKAAAIAEMKTLADQYPNDLNYKGMYADMLLRNDEEERALGLYNEILAEEPGNTHAQVSLRSYYRVQGETEKVDSITELILLNKNTTTEQRIYLMRQVVADSERTDGDSTRVLALFHKMLAQPQQSDDIATLCAAYMDLKKMPQDSVKAMLQTVLRIAPDNAAARLQLVSYAWDRKDHDEVISLCQEARQYNPEEMAFYYYQGMAYYQEENHDKALEAFQNGISVINEESNPAIVSDFYAVMGDLLHQKGMAREAFEAYDSCLQWKDDNVMCLNNYAYYLSEMNEQLDKAEEMSYKTIKAEPKSATYLDTYAWILFMQQRYSEAKIYIDQALQNDSDSSAVITEHAGDIYILNKEPERAVELWQQALKKDPQNKLLARKIRQRKYIKKK
ncbi:MAG: tetratricopeptide repeat protein [Prevotella sp.]|nr:tetratricopeptide repeat protein [Prevotella sp.]